MSKAIAAAAGDDYSDRLNAYLQEFASFGREDVIRVVLEVRHLAVDCVIRLAALVRHFVDLGEDPRDLPLKPSELALFEKIGHGQMLPGLLAGGQFNDLLVRRAAELPIPDQERIVADEPLEVVTGEDTRQIRPSELVPEQIKQLFEGGRMRTLAEQRTWLEGRRSAAEAQPPSAGPYVLNRRRRLLEVREPVSLTLAQLAKIVAQLSENGGA